MTTESLQPPAMSEADIILQELANVGVDPSESEAQELEQNLIKQGPKTQVVQPQGSADISEGLEQSIITGTQAPGLQNNFDQPITVTKVSDPGWIMVYHRFTGDPSVCNANMLPAQLRKRINDSRSEHFGKLAFTTSDPGFRPKVGHGKCWLHADGKYRAIADEWGVEVCTKSNLSSEFDIRMHVRNKHTRQFQALEDHILEIERQEDREERRLILRTLAVQQETRAVTEELAADDPEGEVIDQTIPEAPAAMTEAEVWNSKFKEAEATGTCPVAGEDCFQSSANLKKTRRSNLDRHRKEKHPETK